MPSRCVRAAAALLLTVALCAHGQTTIDVESIAQPVHAARCWTTAVAPNDDGSFDFITQYFNYRSSQPELRPQWITINLTTGEQRSVTDLAGFANGNYQIKNQLRADNGRIFFSAYGNYIHYYEPAEHTVKTLGQLIGGKGDTGNAFFYRLSFGPDGMLYATTQSNNRHVALARIDPDTLTYDVWTDIGSDERTESLTYGYYHAVDPPWVYIAVGQGQWRLSAVNTQTGEQRVLSDAVNWIEIGRRDPGIHVAFTLDADPTFDLGDADMKYVGNILHLKKSRKQYWWCHDGALYPANNQTDASTIPGKHLSERWPAKAKDELALPEIEQSQPTKDGRITARWQLPGDDARGGEVQLQVDRIEAIPIESLTTLPDGRLFGNTAQYNGFFTCDMATGQTTAFGRHGPSRPAVTVVGDQVYFTGYPNSILYRYDPKLPWKTDENPATLGHFRPHTQTHYPYWLIPADNGRIYMGGRCERGVTGSGVGWYNPADGSFHGTHDNLNFLKPRGLRICESINTIVFSGELTPDPDATTPMPDTAELVVYDLDLNEQKRLTVKPALPSTGWLYAAPGSDTQLIGCIEHRDVNALYRYDVSNEKLIAWRDIDTPVDQIITHPDTGALLARLTDHTLCRVDPQTLELTVIGKLSQPAGGLRWIGDRLYGTSGPAIVRTSVIDMR